MMEEGDGDYLPRYLLTRYLKDRTEKILKRYHGNLDVGERVQS